MPFAAIQQRASSEEPKSHSGAKSWITKKFVDVMVPRPKMNTWMEEDDAEDKEDEEEEDEREMLERATDDADVEKGGGVGRNFIALPQICCSSFHR